MRRSDSLHAKARTLLFIAVATGFVASPWHGWKTNVAGTFALCCALVAAVCLAKRDNEIHKHQEQCKACGGRGWTPIP